MKMIIKQIKHLNFVFLYTALGIFQLSCAMQQLPQDITYKSKFAPPNQKSQKTLINGQILAPNETPNKMMDRVLEQIALMDLYLSNSPQVPTQLFSQQLGKLMDEGSIVFSTPILTNAGRFADRPLSACSVPPVDLRKDLKNIKEVVDRYHQDGMGTGYDLSDVEKPIEMLKYLNEIAIEGSQSNAEQRPVGNMAILNVDSPFIEEFIHVKVGADQKGQEWKFNISVNISDQFIKAVENNEMFTLSNGLKINANKLFIQMAEAAHACGDPGLISLERLNADNPTPSLGLYRATAPCAEVGLAPGETCVFGYINLAKFISGNSFDFNRLKDVVAVMTRALDNVLQISIERYRDSSSISIMQAKRKIGIGVCGVADLLLTLKIPYNHQKARDLLQDIINFISYESKVSSMNLAAERGSFSAITESRFMDESFICNKYGSFSTAHVLSGQWKELAKKITESKLLRHASTTALPPTGRSALVIGASTGIEPLFSLYDTDDGFHPVLSHALKEYPASDADKIALQEEIKRTGRCPKTLSQVYPHLITATEISPEDHLAMVIAAQRVIDESISKTVNLPEESSSKDIAKIYLKAYQEGLKGISVYRNNSRTFQPKQLSQASLNEDKH